MCLLMSFPRLPPIAAWIIGSNGSVFEGEFLFRAPLQVSCSVRSPSQRSRPSTTLYPSESQNGFPAAFEKGRWRLSVCLCCLPKFPLSARGIRINCNGSILEGKLSLVSSKKFFGSVSITKKQNKHPLIVESRCLSRWIPSSTWER